MKKNSSSCDPEVQHVIANCDEAVHLHGDVYLKMVYVAEDDIEGTLIGVQACEKDGTPIDGGLLIVEKFGVWERQVIPEEARKRLSVFEFDETNKIRVWR